jgi:hypothetical protein
MRTVCCLIAGLLLIGCDGEHQKASVEDFRRGDRIVAALEKYRAEHGDYPDTLSVLVPTYMRAVEDPDYGDRRWDYIHHSMKRTYGLFMWRRDKAGYGYNVPEPKWEYIDNSF